MNMFMKSFIVVHCAYYTRINAHNPNQKQKIEKRIEMSTEHS